MRQRVIYVPKDKIRERFSNYLSPEMMSVVEDIFDNPRLRLYLDSKNDGGGNCVYPSARKPYYSIYVCPCMPEYETFHTFLHEIAHWKAALRRTKSAHGFEWQEEFKKLMLDHLQLFPSELHTYILDYLDKTPRKRFPVQAYYRLGEIMRRGQRVLYEDWTLSEIPVGTRFRLNYQFAAGNHGTYIKKYRAKNGTSWMCLNVRTGKYKSFAADIIVWNTSYYDFEKDNEEIETDNDIKEQVELLTTEAESISQEAENEDGLLESEAIHRRALLLVCSNYYNLKDIVWDYVSYGNLLANNNVAAQKIGAEPDIRRECEALRYFEEALKISRHLADDDDELSLFSLSAILNDFGRCCFFFDYGWQAMTYFKEALGIRRKWSEINPELWMDFYSNTLWNLVSMQTLLDNTQWDKSLLEEALHVFCKMDEQEPGKYEEELQSIREWLDELA